MATYLLRMSTIDVADKLRYAAYKHEQVAC